MTLQTDVFMIAGMMVSDNKEVMDRLYFNVSRFINLLTSITILLYFFSCQNKTADSTESRKKIISRGKDSLKISLALNKNEFVFLDITDDLLFDHTSLYFHNKTEVDTIVTKYVKKNKEATEIYYSSIWQENGILINYKHYYLIDKKIDDLRLKFEKGDIKLIEPASSIAMDQLYSDYKQLEIKIRNSKRRGKRKLKKELDSLFEQYQLKYISEKDSLKTKLNDSHYMYALQNLNPKDKKVDTYLKNLKNPLPSLPLKMLLFAYTKDKINTFNFNELNAQNYSSEYIEFVAIGLFRFLRFEDQKGDKKFLPAIEWLKTTDLYKRNQTYMEKELLTINIDEFKKGIKNLNLLDLANRKTTFSEIIQQNPSKYYLIDFWATWCGPCIDGVKTMGNMSMPKNVAVISLSIDKQKDKEKWLTETKELNQKFSYRVKGKDIENKEFLKLIELQSIPRYILIDKNMNLLDLAFHHPQEPDFLEKLNELVK